MNKIHIWYNLIHLKNKYRSHCPCFMLQSDLHYLNLNILLADNFKIKTTFLKWCVFLVHYLCWGLHTYYVVLVWPWTLLEVVCRKNLICARINNQIYFYINEIFYHECDRIFCHCNMLKHWCVLCKWHKIVPHYQQKMISRPYVPTKKRKHQWTTYM